MKTRQDIKEYIQGRREHGAEDDEIIGSIENMHEKKDIAADLYYFAMEYIDEELNEMIRADEEWDQEKRGLK